jgi:hypothetical protein
MGYRALFIAALGWLLASSVVWAGPHGWSYPGQYPMPRSLNDRSAQPECGFAATESYGPNGFQFCDPKNIRSPAGNRR